MVNDEQALGLERFLANPFLDNVTWVEPLGEVKEIWIAPGMRFLLTSCIAWWPTCGGACPKRLPRRLPALCLASAGINSEDNPVCYAAALQTLVVMAMDVEDELGSIEPELRHAPLTEVLHSQLSRCRA